MLWEIEEGQKADFDLKAIKGIAAMGLIIGHSFWNQQKKWMSMTLPEEVFEDVPLADEEETTPLETEELTPSISSWRKIQRPLLKKQSYLDEGFLKPYVGRQPLPEEFLLGKSSGYDVSTIHQFISDGKAAETSQACHG